MDRENIYTNNKGMSLVELIVVVLIMGVVSVAGVVGVNNMHSMDAVQVTGSIESLMDRTRLLTITQAQTVNESEEDAEGNVSVILRIKKQNNQYVGIIIQKNGSTEEELDVVEIGDKTIILSYNGTEISDGKDFKFNKGDGSFAGTNEGDKIVVKTVSKTKYVYLVKNTGRCYVE